MAAGVAGRNPTYLILAGFVVSVLGGVLVVVLLARPGQIAVLPQQTTAVVVAARDVPSRTRLADADLEVVQYPSDHVPAKAITAIAQARGKFALTDITRRTAITSAMLGTSVAAASAVPTTLLDVPAGNVAIAIPSGDALANVSGYIQSGDRIDIIVRGLPGQPAGQVNVTFRDLTVQLAGGPAAGVVGGRAPQQGTWVVFVPIQQAEQLVYLFSAGQYTFALKSPADAGVQTGPVPPVGRTEFNSAFNVH